MLGVMQSLTGSRAYDLACIDPGCYAAMVGRGIFSCKNLVIVFLSSYGPCAGNVSPVQGSFFVYNFDIFS